MAEPITKSVTCPKCGNSIPRPPPGAIGKCQSCDSTLAAPDADGIWCRVVGPVELDAIEARALNARINGKAVVGKGRIG
jgi:hypothetical protein